jgi:hypothetical protein
VNYVGLHLGCVFCVSFVGLIFFYKYFSFCFSVLNKFSWVSLND